MTQGDFAGMVQALGTFMLGLGSVGALVMAIRNGHKSDRNAKKLDVLVNQTNGLAKAAAETNRALGVAEEKIAEGERLKGNEDV